MTIHHHLSEPLLIAYAAGNLPQAFALAVASHVSLCDDCRASLASYEALGGAVIEDGDMVPMSQGCLDAVLVRLGAQEAAARPDPVTGILPAPLAGVVGDLSNLKWQPLGRGVRQAILPCDRGAVARLLHIPAGQSVPDHGHRGLELTLVLQGAFRDDSDRFARGDIEIATPADQHTPVAEDGEDCICLAVTDAPLRFAGLMPRLLQPLFRI